MAEHRNVKIVFADKALIGKDDPIGIVRIVNSYENVDVSTNVLKGIHSYDEVRTLFVDLYGESVDTLIRINKFTDFDLACALGSEMFETEDNGLIVSGDVLVRRDSGAVRAMRVLDDDHTIHYFKCTKGKSIVFKSKNFRSFFYAIADYGTKGFHKVGRFNRAIKHSELEADSNIEHVYELRMVKVKGGTAVTVF